MKPIEPGCLAMVIGRAAPEDLGKSVRVGQFVGTAPNFKPSNLWEVDRPLVYSDGFGDETKERVAPEDCLMRIDGHEETEEKQEAINTIQEAIGAT